MSSIDKLPLNEVPQEQLVKCDTIKEPTKSSLQTMGDLLEYTTDVQGQYTNCAVRMSQLINLITKENQKIKEHNDAYYKALKEQQKQ